jgi:phenolphthiocerol/phthiocerol/phthiodiolone dimycocerosyl transferase
VPDLRSPEDLHLEDFRSVLSAKAKPGKMPASDQPDASRTYIISTFGGRLSLEVHHLEDAAEEQQHKIDSLAATIRAALRTTT